MPGLSVQAVPLVAGVVLLLGGGAARSSAETPPPDLVADLERQLTPRSGAPCPGEAAYSLTPSRDPAGFSASL